MFEYSDDEDAFAERMRIIIHCIDTIPRDKQWSKTLLHSLSLQFLSNGTLSGALVGYFTDYKKDRYKYAKNIFLCCETLSLCLKQAHGSVFDIINHLLQYGTGDDTYASRKFSEEHLTELRHLLREFDTEFTLFQKSSTDSTDATTRELNALLTRLNATGDSTR